MNEKKFCIYCYSEMPKEAALCSSCNRFQDARRLLTFSGTILALLVALVSVSSTLVPPFIRAVTEKEALISSRFVSMNGNRVEVFEGSNNDGYQYYTKARYALDITLIITNDGNKTGYVSLTSNFLGDQSTSEIRPISDVRLLVEGSSVVQVEPYSSKSIVARANIEGTRNGVLPTKFELRDQRISTQREDMKYLYLIGNINLTPEGKDINLINDKIEFEDQEVGFQLNISRIGS